jgi:NADH-quinone oxidoreductase subunit A
MPDNYFVRYLPLLIHLAVVTIIPVGMVILSWFLGQHKFNKAKMSPYECGMEPIGNAQGRFSVKFYLVAILFILFDVEAVFMYPWAIIFKDLKAAGAGMFAYCEMLVYVLIVLAGFFYIWKKGVLDWNKKMPGERI